MASKNHIPPRYSLPMAAIVTLFDRVKVALQLPHMRDMTDCWEYQLDDDWWFAANAHRAPHLCSRGFTVPGKHAVITYRRWVVGTVGIYGGHWVHRPGASEHDFLKAMLERIDAYQKPDIALAK